MPQIIIIIIFFELAIKKKKISALYGGSHLDSLQSRQPFGQRVKTFLPK